MEAVCQKCRHKGSCKAPCRPVELYLAEGSLSVYEKKIPGNRTVLYPRSREQRESELDQRHTGEPAKLSLEAFSTDSESPFRHYEANYKQTSIFVKRFFAKWTYKDIAKAHDVSVSAARNIYYAGVQRVLAVIIEMDGVKKAPTTEEIRKRNVARSKRHYERNREKVKAKRRERYAKNKEKIKAKRREAYARKKALSK